jgi:hypothetical protein
MLSVLGLAAIGQETKLENATISDSIIEICVGMFFLVLVIFIHGAGMRFVNRRFSIAWARVNERTPHWRLNLILGTAIGSLAAIHLFETLVWAVPISAAGIIPKMRDSYYYVLESYTTLGEGNVSLPERWRLLGPIIAISGLFTFGWTGSVLVSIMNKFGTYDDGQHGRSQS